MFVNTQNLKHHFNNFYLKTFNCNISIKVKLYLHEMVFTHIAFIEDFLYRDHSEEYKMFTTNFMDYRQQTNQFSKG